VNDFVTLKPERQRLLCQQAAERLGLPAASVEKDFWVCWTLREMFGLPGWGEHLTFNWSWMDYATLQRGSLCLVPPGDQVNKWRRDYEDMQGAMFFGDVPTFDEVLRVVGQFEKAFNSGAFRTASG